MYKIVEEHDGKVSKALFESTRKREIKATFNSFMRSLKMSGSYTIYMIREGYARYTFSGTYGSINGEYYIVNE